MTPVRLLFVGRRQGALAAAARLGADVYVLDDTEARAGRGVVRSARVGLTDPAAYVAAARELLGGVVPDAVIALVERAVIPAAVLRRALGVRGAPPDRAQLWRDKLVMKARAREAGIACAELRTIGRDADARELVRALDLPIVLKPRSASGGRGTVIATNEREVREALREGWLAERFVHGVELSVESFVQSGVVVFENVTEYLRPGWANIVPATLPAHIERAVRHLSRRAIEALEVTDGLSHVEAFVMADDPNAEPTIVFGELACRPPGGSLMELMQRAYGFDPWAAHLSVELGHPLELPTVAARTAGVWFLHPGAGRVTSVEGIDAARAVPGIARVECTVRPGDIVARREGVGQHTGRIVAETSSRDAAKTALETAHALVRIDVEPA